MTEQLEGMLQGIKYLSIHMEKKEVKQEEMEANLKNRGKKYDNLACHFEMHYGIILGFVCGYQSNAGHPIVSTSLVGDIPVEEETVEHTTIALTKQPYLQGD